MGPDMLKDRETGGWGDVGGGCEDLQPHQNHQPLHQRAAGHSEAVQSDVSD